MDGLNSDSAAASCKEEAAATPYIFDEAAAADDGDTSGLTHFLSDVRGSKKGKQKQKPLPLPGKVEFPKDPKEENQAIEQLLSAYRQMIDVPAKKSRKVCFGHRDSTGRLVAIPDKPVGTITRTSGTNRSGVDYLQPEEWVLFVERGSLVIVHSQDEGSEQQAKEDLAGVWTAALGRAGLVLDEYRVYSYLRRLGYVVIRPSPESAAETGRSKDYPLAVEKPGVWDRLAGLRWLTDRPSWLSWTSRLSQFWPSWPSVPEMHTPKRTYDDVYRDLLSCAPRNAALEAATAVKSHYAGGYSVYKPELPYKKRDPGQPQYRMVVESARSGIPATDELLEKAHSDSSISTIFGVSEPAVAGFLSIQLSAIPEAPHRQRERQRQRSQKRK